MHVGLSTALRRRVTRSSSVVYGRRAYRIAHGETTRLGYNANVPATMAPAGRATGRWPYQMLNSLHNAMYIYRYTPVAPQARLLAYRARAHIVTSVVKRLTTSANFAGNRESWSVCYALKIQVLIFSFFFFIIVAIYNETRFNESGAFK